jgi:hypothetical protein
MERIIGAESNDAEGQEVLRLRRALAVSAVGDGAPLRVAAKLIGRRTFDRSNISWPGMTEASRFAMIGVVAFRPVCQKDPSCADIIGKHASWYVHSGHEP